MSIYTSNSKIKINMVNITFPFYQKQLQEQLCLLLIFNIKFNMYANNSKEF